MNVTLKLPRQQRHPWFRRPGPAGFRALAESLPLDRPGEAWEQLARSLRELNFTACPARRRLRCMEPLLQAARRLQETLDRRLTLERFPLSPESAEYAARARETWARLAVGYLCAGRDLRGRDRGARQEVALRGLQCLGRLLLTCYHCYAPEPAGTWQAVHDCRELAGNDAEGTKVPANDTGDATDASTAYKQILVLAATGPLRLRQADQLAVYRVLAHWVRNVSIRPLRGAEPKGPPIVFRPGEDEAPRQYPRDRMPDAPGLRLIDPAPLAGRARHRLELMESGEHGSRLSGELLGGDTLRLLLAAWSGASARQFPRSESDHATALAVGLEATWHALQGSRRPSLRCQLADRSSAGFRAVLERAPPGLLQVGELVATDDRGGWVVGIVRWLRQREDEPLQLGVEAISRHPQPVNLRLDGDGHTCSALLIEENRAAHHPRSLVMPPVPFDEHTAVYVEETGESVSVGRLLESTGSVLRFRVEENGAGV